MENTVFSPCINPRSLIVIKFTWSSLWFIRPWLSCNSILKIANSSAYSQIDNQIEFWIKRCAFVRRILPRIISPTKSWSLPIRNIRMIYLKNSFWIIINVSINLLIVPIKPIDMKIITQSSRGMSVLTPSFWILIFRPIRTPM